MEPLWQIANGQAPAPYKPTVDEKLTFQY